MTKKELIFLGPPASGKGTQTARLAEYLKMPHVDTGALLRSEIKNQTENGKIAKDYIDKGQLVPVDLVASIIKDRLAQPDCKNGYILDGFPRSVAQADMLEIINKEIDTETAEFKAIYFDIELDLLIDRIVYRRSCSACGAIYNIKFNPTEAEGHCDKCGGELTQRKDDNKETAELRFQTYFNETAPLIDYYKNKHLLTTIDANGSVEDVWEKVLKVAND